MIKSINWGDLDYSADDPVEYSIDIDYDWAELVGSFGKGENLGAFADGVPLTKEYESFMKVLSKQKTIEQIKELNNKENEEDTDTADSDVQEEALEESQREPDEDAVEAE